MKPSLRLISAFSRGAPRDRPDQRPLNGAFDARYNVCSLVARETTRAPDGLRSMRAYGPGQRRRRAQEERMYVPRATDENELFRDTAPHALPYYAHKRFPALHVSPNPRVYNYSLPYTTKLPTKPRPAS